MEVKIDPKGEEIFKKPEKPKRKLTDKQKEALAVGRAKAKEKRQQKLREEGEQNAMKKIKQEQKDIEKAKAIADKEKATKKSKLSQQEVAREKVKKFERQKKVKVFNDKKTAMLEKCESLGQFDAISNILGNLTEDDICDEKRLNGKLNGYMNSIKKYADKNNVSY